jgi:cytochrome c peroxidase
VSVIDLATDKVIDTFASAALPQAGTDDAKRLIGKAVFDSSTGVKLATLSSAALSGEVPTSPPRLSNEGWGSCLACHGFGRTDNVVWSFGSGLRRTLSLHATFSPTDASDIKLLNHSAINNEVQDFQNNMLDVSGASEVKDAGGLPIGGLILDATGHTAGGADGSGAGGSKPPLKVTNAGRSAQLDALAFYIATDVKTPSSPLSTEPPTSATGRQIERGRELFALANCASCHGGAGWASGRLNRLPALLTATLDQGVAVTVEVLRDVGTFNASDANELKQNGTAGAGALGFNPPSLLGAFGLAPFLHNGSAQTLADVMALKKHRTSGLLLGAPDPFDDAAKRADIVKFLESIDATTVPFSIP